MYFSVIDPLLTYHFSHSGYVDSKRAFVAIYEKNYHFYDNSNDAIVIMENFVIPMGDNLSTTFSYASKNRIVQQIAFVIAIKKRNDPKWYHEIPRTPENAIPVIFPISFYPCDIGAEFGMSLICFSSGEVRYDWNPTLGGIKIIESQAIDDKFYEGVFHISFQELDERFAFSKEISDMLLFLPLANTTYSQVVNKAICSAENAERNGETATKK